MNIDRPTPLPVRAEGIPETLRHEHRWVGWKYTLRESKWTKPPYVATAPEQPADSTDPTTWRSLDDALGAYEDGKVDGIGFTLGDGYVGFDADHCRDAITGAIDADVRKHFETLDSYVEVSPSGTGCHSIACGQKPGARCRTGPYELYDRGRYFTFTGHHVPGFPTTVEERTANLAAIYGQLFPNGHSSSAHTASTSTLTDDQVIARAMATPKFATLWAGDITGYPSHSEADLGLCSMLAYWTNRDTAQIDRLFRRSGLMREKWSTRRGNSTYGADVIAKAIASTANVYEGHSQRIVTLQAASELTMQQATYLWDERVPVGMLSLITGREGSGKSLVSLTAAADLTQGRLAGCYKDEKKAVIIVATEDAWEFTVLPRLKAARADLTRCFRTTVTTTKHGAVELSLPGDLPALASRIREHDVALLVLDPIISRLGTKLDTHVDAEVRQALEPLRAFAEMLRLSVIGIIHPNKSQPGIPTDPLNMIMGSRAFAAVARSVLFLQADPERALLYLLHIKNNVGKLAPTLELSIRDALAGFDDAQREIHAGCVNWHGARDVNERWQELLHTLRAKEQKAKAPSSARVLATEFLLRYLTTEFVDSQVVIAAGVEAGLSKRTLQRAAEAMNVAKSWTRDTPPKMLWALEDVANELSSL